MYFRMTTPEAKGQYSERGPAELFSSQLKRPGRLVSVLDLESCLHR